MKINVKIGEGIVVMNKLQFSMEKTIKLQNVLICKLNIENEEVDLNAIIEKMQSYIKVKGATQIGPLIQHTRPFINEDGELNMDISLMLQCSNYLCSIEKPYFMESIIRIQNCLYCRFIGPEEKIKFAYDKINVKAFENDIKLTGESYTVFVDKNEEEDTIIADVFVPQEKEGRKWSGIQNY